MERWASRSSSNNKAVKTRLGRSWSSAVDDLAGGLEEGVHPVQVQIRFPRRGRRVFGRPTSVAGVVRVRGRMRVRVGKSMGVSCGGLAMLGGWTGGKQTIGHGVTAAVVDLLHERLLMLRGPLKIRRWLAWFKPAARVGSEKGVYWQGPVDRCSGIPVR